MLDTFRGQREIVEVLTYRVAYALRASPLMFPESDGDVEVFNEGGKWLLYNVIYSMSVTVVFKNMYSKNWNDYKKHSKHHEQSVTIKKNSKTEQLDVFTKFFYGQDGRYLWLSKISTFCAFWC